MKSSVSVTGHYLPYAETGYFSPLVLDYLRGDARLRDLYACTPDLAGIGEAIKSRASFPVNRKLLTETLKRQYASLQPGTQVARNLELLALDNTYTVCTAHQPNLMTGYLYFIYKILHAVKLAEALQEKYPDQNFVPVYYMGSEDNDLDELGRFRYGNQSFVWDAGGQSGAVGRMNTASLKPLLESLFRLLGPPGIHTDNLRELISEAYLKHATVAAATRFLVHELFGRFGLIVLDPDEADFKRELIPIFRDELLQQHAYGIVTEQADRIAEHYKVQAHPRQINLFYLTDGVRERIERTGDRWSVVHTGVSWSEQELMAELDLHPERFSPNVILRGLLQERILPDVAFIGGGSEVAYWLQLRQLFALYKVFFPALLLRQSVLWIDGQAARLQQQLAITTPDLFLSEDALCRSYIQVHGSADWQTGGTYQAFQDLFAGLRQQAVAVDATLGASADATLAKMQKQLHILEHKMYRAEKRNMQHQVQRIRKLKELLFPGGNLQERSANFLDGFLRYGPAFFDLLKDAIKPLEQEFLVLYEPGPVPA